MLGCTVCIGGVFAYSLVRSRSSNTAAHPPLSPLATRKRAAAALLLTPARSSVRRSSRDAALKPCCAAEQKGEGHRDYLWDACSPWNARR